MWRAGVCAALALVVAACAAVPDGGPEDGGPSHRGPGARGPGQPARGESWKGYDPNGDGKVTRAEFAAVRALCFARHDLNDDGALARTELQRRLPPRLLDRLDSWLARLDRDGDGQIRRDEFDQESDHRFRALDTNGDAVIAGTELNALGSLSDVCQQMGSPGGDGPDAPGPGGRGPGGGRRPR